MIAGVGRRAAQVPDDEIPPDKWRPPIHEVLVSESKAPDGRLSGFLRRRQVPAQYSHSSSVELGNQGCSELALAAHRPSRGGQVGSCRHPRLRSMCPSGWRKRKYVPTTTCRYAARSTRCRPDTWARPWRVRVDTATSNKLSQE